MKWFRVYHDMVTDPKLHEIARRARVSRGLVIAAWVAILTTASKNDVRGVANGINPVQLGYLIDVKPAVAERILTSIIEQVMMLSDGTIPAWSQRQRASDDVNPRVRRSRDQKTKPLESNETDDESNVTNPPRFREEKKESTNVDSPPIPPTPEPISPSAQSAAADVFLDPEPQFELMVPTEAKISTASVPAVYDATPSLPAKRHVYSAEFERFWAIYPRKKSKGFAEKAWKNAIKTIGSDDLIAKLQERVPVLMMKPMYIPHPATWLNARGWEDEITQYDLMPQERTGTIGAVAYLMQNGKTDAFSDEINGMSERERELLSLPAWQNAIEGPAHRDDDGERCGDDRGPGRGAGTVHPGGGSGDVHRVGSSEQVVAEPVGAFGAGAGLRREAGPQGKSGAQIYAFRAA